MANTMITVERDSAPAAQGRFGGLLWAPLVRLLNALPAGLSKRLFLAFSGPDGDPAVVSSTVTTYMALENMYTFPGRKAEGTTRLPDRVWQGLANAEAVRSRLLLTEKMLSEAIREVAARQKEIRLCSLGSGSARAVIEVLSRMDEQEKVKCLFIDISGKALRYGEELARTFHIRSGIDRRRDYAENIAVHCNGSFTPDIIEMVGLLDYYDREGAVRLVSEIYRKLAPSGWFITCNITHNLEQPFVTKGIGWPLIYRSPGELMGVMCAAGFAAGDVRLIAESQDIHILAVAQKKPAADI